MVVRFRPAGQVSPTHAYLEVLLVGLGSLSARKSHLAAVLIPIPQRTLPAAYVAGVAL
jgi:hypothetical protein